MWTRLTVDPIELELGEKSAYVLELKSHRLERLHLGASEPVSLLIVRGKDVKNQIVKYGMMEGNKGRLVGDGQNLRGSTGDGQGSDGSDGQNLRGSDESDGQGSDESDGQGSDGRDGHGLRGSDGKNKRDGADNRQVSRKDARIIFQLHQSTFHRQKTPIQWDDFVKWTDSLVYLLVLSDKESSVEIILWEKHSNDAVILVTVLLMVTGSCLCGCVMLGVIIIGMGCSIGTICWCLQKGSKYDDVEMVPLKDTDKEK